MDTRVGWWFHLAVRDLPPRLLLNLLLAGVFLRLANLAAFPLWLDEGATWVAATRPTWMGTVFAEANHPPLWWLITRGWIQAFGDGVLQLRAPAALLGVLGTWLTWCVLLRVLDPARVPARGGFDRTPDGGRGRSIAAWATGLVAVSAYFLEYAQEARMYPLLLVLALGTTLVYLRWLDRPSAGWLVLYAALATLALYTHYFGVLVVGAHALHAIWVLRRAALPFLVAVAASGLLFVPWLAYLLTHYSGIQRARPEPFSTLLYALWRIGVGPGILATSPERAAQGGLAVARSHPALVGATILLWIVPVLLGVFAIRRRPGLRALAGFTLLFPVVFVLAVYPFFALIHERYFLFLAPWVVLLAVLGAFSLPRAGRALALIGLALLAAAGTFAFHGAPTHLVREGHRFVPDPDNPITKLTDGHPYGREPWDAVHDFVRSRAAQDDLVAIHAWYMDYVWRYYAEHDPEDRPALDTLLLPQHEWDAEKTREAFADRLAGRKRVFLVLSHEETPDPDHWRGALMGAMGFTRLQQFQFPHGIRVEILQ